MAHERGAETPLPFLNPPKQTKEKEKKMKRRGKGQGGEKKRDSTQEAVGEDTLIMRLTYRQANDSIA
jgi:hypothetical protein